MFELPDRAVALTRIRFGCKMMNNEDLPDGEFEFLQKKKSDVYFEGENNL